MHTSPTLQQRCEIKFQDMLQRLRSCFLFGIIPFYCFLGLTVPAPVQEIMVLLLGAGIFFYALPPFFHEAIREMRLKKFGSSTVRFLALAFLGSHIMLTVMMSSSQGVLTVVERSLFLIFALLAVSCLELYVSREAFKRLVFKDAKSPAFVNEMLAGVFPFERYVARVEKWSAVASCVLSVSVFGVLCAMDVAPVLAFERMIAVMLIALPGLVCFSSRIAIMNVYHACMKRGIIVQKKESFEKALGVDVVMFEKTGTLTQGTFTITDVIALGGLSTQELLAHAAALEMHSTHPLAHAIVTHAQGDNLFIPAALDCAVNPGRGTQGMIEGKSVFVGNRRMMEGVSFQDADAGMRFKESKKIIKKLAQQGKSVVFIATQEKVQGIIAGVDQVRVESKKACAALMKKGFQVALLTGDNKYTAHVLASALGIKNVLAEVLPKKKISKIKDLQKEGESVALVKQIGGNDLFSTGADIAIALQHEPFSKNSTAHIVITNNELENVSYVLSALKKTKKNLYVLTGVLGGYTVLGTALIAGVGRAYGIAWGESLSVIMMVALVAVSATSKK